MPTLHGDTAAERQNRMADGQPGYWCRWVPCPRGCCRGRVGHEKFYAGGAWLQYLIDHLLRPGAHAKASRDSSLRRFTSDHDLDGVVVGEQDDNRELFSLTVEHGEVTRTTLHRGEPMPWDPGYVAREVLPWRGWEASLAELERREALAAVDVEAVSASPRKRGGPRRR